MGRVNDEVKIRVHELVHNAPVSTDYVACRLYGVTRQKIHEDDFSMVRSALFVLQHEEKVVRTTEGIYEYWQRTQKEAPVAQAEQRTEENETLSDIMLYLEYKRATLNQNGQVNLIDELMAEIHRGAFRHETIAAWHEAEKQKAQAARDMNAAGAKIEMLLKRKLP